MIRYIFREDEVLRIKNANKANAQMIGEALAEVTKAAKGRLTPQATEKAAQDPESPLHKHFEWNNEVAGYKFRIEQARSLIRSIHAVETKEKERPPMRAFLSIADKGGVSYRAVEEVLSSAELQRKVLEQAHRDLIAFETRYRSLEDVCKLVREAREKLEKRISKPSKERPQVRA